MDCPLCLEEIDLSDANFKPCPCGYQVSKRKTQRDPEGRDLERTRVFLSLD